jgi:hypothetical protein
LFQERLEKLPDKRKGKNKQYEMRDAGLSAFGKQFSLWQKPYLESKNRLSSYRNETP